MRPLRLAAIAALVAVLSACGGSGGGDSVTYSSATPQEPTAGSWQTWIVADVTAIRPPPPPGSDSEQTRDELDVLRSRALVRTPSDEANVDFWNGGTARRWNELQRDLIVSRLTNPPKAARGFALVSMAMFDAMVASWDAKFSYLRARPSAFPSPPAVYGPENDSPSYVSERAAISAAAATVLKALFPSDTALIDGRLAEAQLADLDACVHFPSDVNAGVTLGEAVGAQVLAYAATDHGDDPQPAYTATGTPGLWAPTPPGNVSPPLLPGWGLVDTFLLPGGSAFRPAAPPAFNSTEWIAQRDEVLTVALTLTPERQALATFWADGSGTVTPPGHWNQIAVDLAVAEAFDEPRMCRMLAGLGAAQHDAFVACWDCKFHYDCERPVSTIRRDVAGQSGFLPFITTPPFPSYPSGHSSTSGAASQVLGYFFPSDAVELAGFARDAKDSRLYGGIHFRFDNDVGLDLGRSIGTLAIIRLESDGAP
jgi:hypothetical protein